MNMTRIIILLLLPFSISAQVTISDGTSLAVRGIFATNGNILNNNSDNSRSNMAEARLILTGSTTQQLSTKSRSRVGNLIVTGGGEKIVTGEWEITNSLQLENGLLTPASSGKIIFSLRAEGQQSITANENSFVNGMFYSKGSGLRTFPIGFKNGAENIHAPVALGNGLANAEVGIRIVNEDAGLVSTAEYDEILTSRYWQIDATEPVNSKIILNTNGLTLPVDKALVVVQSSSVGGVPENLKGSVEQSKFVSSDMPVNKPIVTLAMPRVFEISIHDLITPFNKDGANDMLFIENIGLTAENTVTLLDRWGVAHQEWKNYKNETDYKFERLSPGNYICIVEYRLPGTSEKKKISQMVTILGTN